MDTILVGGGRGFGGGGLFLEGLAGGGIGFERAGEFELVGDLAHGGDDVFAHEAKATHLVFVCHRAIAVPEEDAAGSERFEYVPDLGYDGVRGAGYDGVVFDLFFVGCA